MWWRIIAVRTYDIPHYKLRRGEDHALGPETTRISAFFIESDDVNASVTRNQFNRRAIELNVCFSFFKQVTYQASIAFGP